jgi:hypothetical protein
MGHLVMMAAWDKLAMCIVNSLVASIPQRIRNLATTGESRRSKLSPTIISKHVIPSHQVLDMISVPFDRRWTLFC